MVLYQKKLLVSISIPTYNCARYLKKALESIINQTYDNLEIIISDNASTDDTLTLLQEFNDPRIKIYRNSKNIGAEKNFSKCVELAGGEYIAIFHADDLYLPDMVQKQVQTFQDNPSIGAVFTLANYANDRDKVIGQSKLPVELKGKGTYYFPEIFLSILSNLNFLICPSAMVKSKIYKELIPFNDERFATSADLDMWLRILEKHPIAILNEKLMSWRISNIQGSYQTRYLRTDRADFFRVMDYYLSNKVSNMDIPKNVLNKYEFLKSIDNIKCAVNYIIKGQSQDAKKLLKKSFSTNIFWGAMRSVRKPKFLAYWIFGAIFLSLIYLGLGKYLGTGFHWLLYDHWKRRFA